MYFLSQSLSQFALSCLSKNLNSVFMCDNMLLPAVCTCEGVWDVIFDHDVDEHSRKNQRLVLLVPQADVTIT